MGPQRFSPTCEFGATRHLNHPTPSGPCPGWQEGWPLEPYDEPEPPPAKEPRGPRKGYDPVEELPPAQAVLRAHNARKTVTAALERGETPPADAVAVLAAVPEPKAPEPRHPSVDWPAVKARYVEGFKQPDSGIAWPTLADVAAHFSVSVEAVKHRSRSEGWPEQRSRWQAQVEKTRQHARAASLAKSGLDLDTKALDASKLGLQLVFFELQRTAAEAQKQRTASGDNTGGKIASIELQRLGAAAELFHKLGLRAVGDPDARVELTGAGGGAIEIGAELRRDDPTRIADVLGVLAQAGLGEVFGMDTESQVMARELAAENGLELGGGG